MPGICIDPNCIKYASYNILGQPPKYCGTHKTDGMININGNYCIDPTCSKFASFNLVGQKPRFCGTHKLPDMIKINANYCIDPDCSTRATYNLVGQKPIFCGTHKTDNMICINYKLCIDTDCSKTASYNIEGQPARFCGTHKTDEMIIINGKYCINPDCSKKASYNILGQQPRYCVSHKTEEMVDVNHKTCHLCETRVSNKAYRGYCLRCFINTFPTEKVARNYKTKERNVVDCIKQVFPDLDWKEDRKVSCGCSKRRPDLFLDLATRVIVAEIDENQHTDYNSNCETKRMMEIYQDARERPIVFIRFNPDKYTNGNVKITSCWGIDGNGMTVVKKCKIKEWKDRTDTLNNQIQYCIDNPSDKMIDVVHLFYDV